MSAPENLPEHFIQIDEDGYFKIDELRIADLEAGRDWLKSLTMDERGRPIANIGDKRAFIEAFDEPYVALDIEKAGADWRVTMPYGHSETFTPETLTLDEWDRFHGLTDRKIPFALSRSAQARFFNLLDEFDDDAIIVDGRRIEMRPWLQENPDANDSAWWTNIYRTEEPRWELNEPSHALPSIVPRLKLQKSRVLVLGAGTGNDAAWFAEQGHLVTAVDFSEEAIARAKNKYGYLPNLKLVQADVFNLPAAMTAGFDIVFEHTLYCAVTPSRRQELIKIWRRLLSEQGHLMGVFGTFHKPFGPPFGGTEWELRARLGKGFRPLFWTRLRDSRPTRQGRELFVFAQKVAAF